MELKEFVRSTLVQIVDGVNDAREEIEKKGGSVNPVGGSFDQPSLAGRQWSFADGATEIVNFDVALTQEDAKESKGGIGVFLGGVGLGAQGKSDSSSSSLSRIQFQVPLLLPKGKNLKFGK